MVQVVLGNEPAEQCGAVHAMQKPVRESAACAAWQLDGLVAWRLGSSGSGSGIGSSASRGMLSNSTLDRKTTRGNHQCIGDQCVTHRQSPAFTVASFHGMLAQHGYLTMSTALTLIFPAHVP